MVKIRNNWTLKVVIMLCMVMQSVALFPHHHHDGSEVPCLNLFHCESHGDSDHADCDADPAACCDHRHDASDDACGIRPIEIVQPPREESFSHDDAGCDLCGWGTLAVFVIPGANALAMPGLPDSQRAQLRQKHRPFVEPLHLTYLTRASLLRAPTFLA